MVLVVNRTTQCWTEQWARQNFLVQAEDYLSGSVLDYQSGLYDQTSLRVSRRENGANTTAGRQEVPLAGTVHLTEEPHAKQRRMLTQARVEDS
jgi:hypothetical protein